jgi:hypothetical protein
MRLQSSAHPLKSKREMLASIRNEEIASGTYSGNKKAITAEIGRYCFRD